MNYQNLTFEDIMQDKILYYDEEVKAACFDICHTLNINTMPDYHSSFYFELIEHKFVRKIIDDKNKLQTSDRIFDYTNLNKFKSNKHNVLFVFKGKILKGIVHFSDYNKNAVLKRIQEDILNFEMNLRELLILNGKNNEDIIKFYEYSKEKEKKEGKKSYFQKRLEFLTSKVTEMKQLGTFQLCELSDLMSYTCSSFSNKLFKFDNHNNISGNKIIGDLRNLAMHGKNPIEKDIDTSIFSIESLQRFEHALEILHFYSTKLEGLIYENEDYIKSVQMENRRKLIIIHQHHPRALKYFIGY
jgi:hypothetical protein